MWGQVNSNPTSDHESAVRGFCDAVLPNDLALMEAQLSPTMDAGLKGQIVNAFSRWKRASDEQKDGVRVDQAVVRSNNGKTAVVGVTFKDGTADHWTASRVANAWLLSGLTE